MRFRKYLEAQGINEESLGLGHLNTAVSLNNLAALYDGQGKYREAEPLLSRALAICEQELGPRHPDTASSLNNLGMLYDGQEKYAEAEPLLVRAVKILERSLGAEHPSTRMGRSNYARLLRKLGREEETVALEVEGNEGV